MSSWPSLSLLCLILQLKLCCKAIKTKDGYIRLYFLENAYYGIMCPKALLFFFSFFFFTMSQISWSSKTQESFSCQSFVHDLYNWNNFPWRCKTFHFGRCKTWFRFQLEGGCEPEMIFTTHLTSVMRLDCIHWEISEKFTFWLKFMKAYFFCGIYNRESCKIRPAK